MTNHQTFTLTVNGTPHQVNAAPNSNLMDVIRDQLRLTGTKDGCGTGHCGSCMVIRDGKAERSCLVSMKKCDGAEVTTIEGVAAPEAANNSSANGSFVPMLRLGVPNWLTLAGPLKRAQPLSV